MPKIHDQVAESPLPVAGGETGVGAVPPIEAVEAAAAPIVQGAEAIGAATLDAFSPSGEGKAMGFYGEALFDRARAVAAEYVSWAGKSLERQAQGMSELMACRTPSEVLDVQNRLIRDNVEALITTADRTSRLTAQALSSAKDASPSI